MLIFAVCLKISADRNVVLATPADEKLSLPGFFCASAMNSFSVLAGESGGTTAASGADATTLMPAKSFTGSNGTVLLIARAMVCPFEVSISVWPSGLLVATVAVPGRPGRFSTMTCCFHMPDSLSARMRARPSVMLPAENGTTIRTVWFG